MSWSASEKKISVASSVFAEQLLQVVVVGVAGRQRLLEDRRVRGDADDGVLVHHPLQLARVDEVARERVEPHRLPARRELMEP